MCKSAQVVPPCYGLAMAGCGSGEKFHKLGLSVSADIQTSLSVGNVTAQADAVEATLLEKDMFHFVGTQRRIINRACAWNSACGYMVRSV